MNKIAILLLLIPVVTFSQRDKFEVKGKLTGVMNGELIYLTDANNPTDTLSRDVLKDGQFNLKGSIKEPNLHHLNFGANKKTLLFVGNDDIKVEGNVEDIKTISVSGSTSHNDFVEFQKILNPLFQRYTDLNRQAQAKGLSDSLTKLLNVAYNDIHNVVQIIAFGVKQK